MLRRVSSSSAAGRVILQTAAVLAPAPFLSLGSAKTTPTTSALSCSQRFFWNPFSSGKQQQALVKLAEKHMADSDALVEAALVILKSSNDVEKFSERDRDALTEVVSAVLTDSKKPGVQYDCVYVALSLPAVRGDETLKGELMVVLESILPREVYAVFDECGDQLFLLVENEEESGCSAPQDALRKMVYVLLGDLSLLDAELDELDVDQIFLDAMTQCVVLKDCASFAKLRENPNEAILRARIFSLIAELCATMDKEKTGKVSLDELRSSIVAVAGEAEAARLLEGTKPDLEGKIRYHQLSAILTRPPAAPAAAQ